MFLNNHINWEGLDLLLPPHVVDKINNLQIRLNPATPDDPKWIADNNGTFSVASAWQLFRKKKQKSWVNIMNWQNGVPFKMNFIVWRALRDKIPTDTRVTRLGYSISPRYCCCGSPSVETVDHLFCNGLFAKELWKILCGPMGIAFSDIPYRQLMVNWWRCKVRNPVHTLIVRCLPVIASWELWSTRCKAKYDNVRINVRRSLSLILFSVTQLVNSQFQ